MISISSQFILWTYVLCSAFAIGLSEFRPPRVATLRRLLWANFLAAALIALIIHAQKRVFSELNPFGNSRQELFLVMLLTLLFVGLVEIPGFVLNSLHDRRVVESIEKFESALLEIRVDPLAGIDNALNYFQANRANLAGAGLGAFVAKSLETFRRLRNADLPLLEAVIRETSAVRRHVSERSKHPAPDLVKVFGLAGFGFLLAEILSALRRP